MLITKVGGVSGDSILIRGHELLDLLDKHDFAEVLYLQLTGSFPDASARRMMNVLLISGSDHGMTPSAIAARLTLYGAPEALQGALASGLLGAGSRLVGTIETSAALLSTTIASRASWSKAEIDEAAERLVTQYRATKKSIPGLGHSIHTTMDPRTARILDIAKECGFFGNHCILAMALSEQASRLMGRALPLNAPGAKAGIVLDMGLTPAFGKAVTLVGRAGGVLAHLLEEQQEPIGDAIWDLVRKAVASENS